MLATHPLVKTELDYYLNPDKRWLELRDILFDYCNSYQTVPAAHTVHKGCNIRNWLQTQKKKISTPQDPIYTKLSTHPLIKTELDRYLTTKNKNKATHTNPVSSTM